jgi:hypothetical protein
MRYAERTGVAKAKERKGNFSYRLSPGFPYLIAYRLFMD